MHDVLSVAITVATIMIATYFSNSAINTLRGEMHSLRSELVGKMDSIQRDMREFYAEQARHDNTHYSARTRHGAVLN